MGVSNINRLMPGTGIAGNRDREQNTKGTVVVGQCISKNVPTDKVLKVRQTVAKVSIKGTMQMGVCRIIIGTITNFPVAQFFRRRIWRGSSRGTRFQIRRRNNQKGVEMTAIVVTMVSIFTPRYGRRVVCGVDAHNLPSRSIFQNRR